MFSKEALLSSACQCGLLEDETPILINETLRGLKDISAQAIQVVFDHPEENGLSMRIIQQAFNYSFLKGMEAFFLWQAVPQKQIVLKFSQEELFSTGDSYEVSYATKDFINDAMDKCLIMVNDFREWLKTNQDLFQGGFLDLYDELSEAFVWSCRIGLSYAASTADRGK